ncbi:MAG: O-antigen ligase family protein [Phycisphaerae bacterium]|nr:O-antigen ligase family protein [Phycisphaerae bacterium]
MKPLREGLFVEAVSGSMNNLWSDKYSLAAQCYQQTNRFDRLVECLMGALLVFMPLAFGGVHRWSEMVILVVVSAMALCVILKHGTAVRGFGLRGDSEEPARWVWTWAYVPMILFVLLIAFQLLPLPARLVEVLSPNTWDLKQVLMSDIAGEEPSGWMTLTFYPLATRHDLRMVVMVATLFFVVVNVYHSVSQIKRLLLIVALVGAGVAILTLAQNFLGNGKLYWHMATGDGVVRSGPFVNHGHFGQYMNLSIGAALALLLATLYEAVACEKNNRYARSAQVTQDYSGQGNDRKRGSQWPLFAPVVARLARPSMHRVWMMSVMIVLGVITLCLSLTRGGMVSMLVAGAFTIMMMVRNRQYTFQIWIMVVLAMGAFICILYLGSEAVYDRMVSLGDLKNYDNRLGIIKSLAPVVGKFGFWGVGLGAHAMVYPMWDMTHTGKLVRYAENEYVQVLAETGVGGLCLVLLVLAMVWRHYFRCIRHEKLPICMAAFGLGFGLLAAMIHSVCDFGQHVPVNSGLAAIFCGLLVNLGRLRHDDTRRPQATGGRRATVQKNDKKRMRWTHRFPPVAGGGGCASLLGLLLGGGGLWSWMLIDAENACAAQKHWEQVLRIDNRLQKNNWQGRDGDYRVMLAHAGQAVRHQPGNVEYYYWLNVYRWLDLDRRNSDKSDRDYQREVDKLIHNFHQGRALCPVYGPLYFMAGQLEYYVAGPYGNEKLRQDGAAHVQVAARLAGGHPTISWGAGLLNIQQGNMNQSTEIFRRYVNDGGDFDRVIAIYIDQYDRSDLAMAVAGDEPMLLDRLATSLSRLEGYATLEKAARAHAIDILEGQVAGKKPPVQTLVNLGHVYYHDGDYQNASRVLGWTLERAPERIDCRYLLAESLAKVNQVPRAIAQARRCMQMRPDWKKPKMLVERLENQS